MEPLRDQATFYRAALLLGLIPGKAVQHWADAIIHREEAPAPALFDVTLTPADDLSAMRGAIRYGAPGNRMRPGRSRSAVRGAVTAAVAAGARPRRAAPEP